MQILITRVVQKGKGENDKYTGKTSTVWLVCVENHNEVYLNQRNIQLKYTKESKMVIKSWIRLQNLSQSSRAYYNVQLEMCEPHAGTQAFNISININTVKLHNPFSSLISVLYSFCVWDAMQSWENHLITEQ